MARILKNFPKEKLINDYLPHVMENRPEKAADVFNILDPQKFFPS